MCIDSNRRKIALQVVTRYHTRMKKSTLKLVVRRETLRVLDEMDLVQIVGGNPDARLDTGGPNTSCPLVQAAQPAKP